MNELIYVLDASAILAMLQNERGAAHVEQRLGDACISTVNLSEVIAKLQDRAVPDDIIDESLGDFDLKIIPFDMEQADRAGKLRAVTRRHGLSFGDRACLALADILGATALTTDITWSGLDIGMRIELART